MLLHVVCVSMCVHNTVSLEEYNCSIQVIFPESLQLIESERCPPLSSSLLVSSPILSSLLSSLLPLIGFLHISPSVPSTALLLVSVQPPSRITFNSRVWTRRDKGFEEEEAIRGICVCVDNCDHLLSWGKILDYHTRCNTHTATRAWVWLGFSLPFSLPWKVDVGN